jgi:hypothetical protein
MIMISTYRLCGIGFETNIINIGISDKNVSCLQEERSALFCHGLKKGLKKSLTVMTA